MHIDPQGSPCWLPTTAVSTWSGHKGGRTWQWPIGSMSSLLTSPDSNFPVDGKLRECRLPGEHFQQRCQAYRVHTGGGLVHIWGACHSGAESPVVLPDIYLTSELYRGILWNTLVPFARQHFGDNYQYQDDNASPHHAQVVLDFLQQANVTMMEQPARYPHCNPIEYIWDELGSAITSMDNLPQNLGELCQALLDKWAEIPVECLQRLVASMPQRLVVIIAARCGNTWYWPGKQKTTQQAALWKKIKFVWPDLPNLPSHDIYRYAHAANFSNINKCYHKFTKIHIKQNSAYNT